MSDLSALIWAAGRGDYLNINKDPRRWPVIEGVPIWQRQIDVIRQLVPQEIFWIGPAPKELPTDVRVIFQEGHGQKQLLGLLAAIRLAASERLLVLGLDLAAMTPEFLGRLLKYDEGAAPFICRDSYYNTEPFASLFPTDIEEDIETVAGIGAKPASNDKDQTPDAAVVSGQLDVVFKMLAESHPETDWKEISKQIKSPGERKVVEEPEEDKIEDLIRCLGEWDLQVDLLHVETDEDFAFFKRTPIE